MWKQESLLLLQIFHLNTWRENIFTVISCEDFTRQHYNKDFILSKTTKSYFSLSKALFPFYREGNL